MKRVRTGTRPPATRLMKPIYQTRSLSAVVPQLVIGNAANSSTRARVSAFSFLSMGAPIAHRVKTTIAIVATPVKTVTRTAQGMVIRRTAPSWPLTPAMLVPSTTLAGAIALP